MYGEWWIQPRHWSMQPFAIYFGKLSKHVAIDSTISMSRSNASAAQTPQRCLVHPCRPWCSGVLGSRVLRSLWLHRRLRAPSLTWVHTKQDVAFLQNDGVFESFLQPDGKHVYFTDEEFDRLKSSRAERNGAMHDASTRETDPPTTNSTAEPAGLIWL